MIRCILPKGTPSPLKTPVNETEVSLNSSCQTEAVFLALGNCVFLIIRSCFDKHDYPLQNSTEIIFGGAGTPFPLGKAVPESWDGGWGENGRFRIDSECFFALEPDGGCTVDGCVDFCGNSVWLLIGSCGVVVSAGGEGGDRD